MAKSRSFSIYLLKRNYSAQTALEEDHALEAEVHASDLPDGATLFVLDADAKPPWWRSYFGIRKNLDQVHKGALIFLPTKGRCFALCFGHVAHNLKKNSYEYDFGLRVTLNCVDPKKLRSTDILEPGEARRRRTQMPIEFDLTLFDFDRDSTILRSLTGKVSDAYRDLFKHATGASGLRVNSALRAAELVMLCDRLLSLYQSEEYKSSFPEIQNIAPIKDPSLVAELNDQLVGAFRSANEALSLSVPDLINYQDNVYAVFTGAGGRSDLYDDVFIGRYYEYLQGRGIQLSSIGFDDLRKHLLLLTDENGSPREKFSIYKSMVFDLQKGGQSFHLTEGNWYKVEAAYVARLGSDLDPFCVDIALPSYNHANEGAYNIAAAATGSNLICLDKTNISPSGQSQIEPCDLYCVANGAAVFHHVKVSTLSNQLSHLFNQGANAIELIKLEPIALRKLKALVGKGLNSKAAGVLTAPLDLEKYEVIFAIVTHKSKVNKSMNLPLFSRMSLMRNMKALQLMSVKGGFGFVERVKPSMTGKPKSSN